MVNLVFQRKPLLLGKPILNIEESSGSRIFMEVLEATVKEYHSPNVLRTCFVKGVC